MLSSRLLDELERVLAYAKIRKRIPETDAAALLSLLRRQPLVQDPHGLPPVRSSDPDDDYLIALASATRAALVSGGDHVLELQDQIPALLPAAFLARLTEKRGSGGTGDLAAPD